MRFKKHVNKPLAYSLFVGVFGLLYFVNPACAWAYCIGLVMMYNTIPGLEVAKNETR